MNKSRIIKFIILVVLAVSLIIVLSNHHIRGIIINPHRLRHFIASFSNFAPIIFIVLYTARTFLIGFPAGVFTVASGALFGKVYGFGFAFVFSMVGAFLSASLAFWLGKNLMSDFVQKHLADKLKILNKDNEGKFKLIFYLRFIMLMPFDIFGYAAGAANIKYKDFILGTILGIIPEFLGYTYLGYAGVRKEVSWEKKLLISFVIIGFILLGHFGKVMIARIREKKIRK